MSAAGVRTALRGLWRGVHTWTITLRWEWRDFWIGVYWTGERNTYRKHVFVCPLPFLPLHLSWLGATTGEGSLW